MTSLYKKAIRELALRWAAERAIASYDDDATDEQVVMVRSHGVLAEYEREALLGWVRYKMTYASMVVADSLPANAPGEIAYSKIVLCEFIGGELNMRACDVEPLCEAAGWPGVDS